MAEILSVATETPPHRITKRETQAYLSHCLPERHAVRFERALETSGNRARYAVLPMDELIRLDTVDRRNQCYAEHAITLAERVARTALSRADIQPDAIDRLVCVSATGYMMPSLDVHLVNRLGLRPSCRRIALSHLGCAGGVGSLALAAEATRAGDSSHALIVSVELPSLSLQTVEPSPSDILSGLQFGDGAAAAVMSAEPARRGLECVTTQSVLFRNSAERDGIRVTQTGLRLIRSRGLTALVAAEVPRAVHAFVQANELSPHDVGFWVVHPRTPQLLEAIRAGLDLSTAAVAPSWAVWEAFGNMISASIFFVLREMETRARPTPGTLGLVLAVGAGMSCEMMLVRSWGSVAYPEASSRGN